jgi:aminopeptidase N
MEIKFKHGCSHFEHFHGASFGGAEAEDHYPPDLGLATAHLEIRLRVGIPTEELFVQVAHDFVANREGVSEVTLDGVEFEDLSVSDASHEPNPMDFRYDGKKIHIRWHSAFRKGEMRKVNIRYKVDHPKTGVFFMYPTEFERDRPLYVATDHETERARYWLACIDFPILKTTIDWYITADENLTILANGSLVTETRHGDGSKTAFWSLKQLCPSYLACFAVGDFIEERHGNIGGVEIASFATKKFTSRDLELSFSKTGKMLTWMIDKLKVPFPYPKYYQFALPNFGGAMENISLVSWSDHLLCTEESHKEQSWLIDQVNVHEMAHSYFGDLVGCKDFAHVWLKESWATYMETCWLEDEKGQDEMRYDLWRNAQSYFDEADTKYQRPLVTRRYHSSWQLFDNHLYPGGACRLHVLRCHVGNENFWNAVHEYLVRFQNQVVETDDFRKVMEKYYGASLQKFFDQWVYRSGYPHLKVTFTYEKEHQRGLFEIQQEQSENKEIFDFKTHLGWCEKIEGKLVHHVYPIVINKVRQTFFVPMSHDPIQVRFDPLGEVLHKLEFDPGESRALSQLFDAPDIVGRIQAARVIAAAGKTNHLKKIIEAYKKESFWGVRREMIKYIGDVCSQKSIELLIELLSFETDHLVLERLFATIGMFRDQSVKEALVSAIKQKKLPPKALSAALYGIGYQNTDDVIDVLKEQYFKDSSPQKIPARAALHALGFTQSIGIIDFLTEIAVKKRCNFRTRKGAILGLGVLIPYIEPHHASKIRRTLIDLLRDEEFWVRDAVIQAMAAGKVEEAVPALTDYASRVPLQDRLAVNKVIAELNRHSNRVPSAFEKMIEELKSTLRKLQNRVQDLEDSKMEKS